ncbi:MAG: hypothetical protein ACD_56C00103G0002 [uncultured bacterium]|nr:MAG: hypothetical protein ACD_56C00103G0002 [uncultured bacterium]
MTPGLPKEYQKPCSDPILPAKVKAIIALEASVETKMNSKNNIMPTPLSSIEKRLEKKLTKYTMARKIKACVPTVE